jgi:hypothetical protein
MAFEKPEEILPPGEMQESHQPERGEVDPELLNKLQLIAKIIGGDFGMKIELGKRGGGSYTNSEENKIVFDPEHLISDPQEAMYTAAHEGAHRAITRGPHQIGLKEEKIRELWGQIGFGFLNRMIEEPAVDSWMTNKFEGLRSAREYIIKKWVENVANAKEGTLAHLGMFDPEAMNAFKMLGYVPKFVLWGKEFLLRMQAGVESEDMDAQVAEVFQHTFDKAARSSQTVPEYARNEEEVIDKAKERFLVNLTEIWPEFKKLVEEDLSQEKIAQMVKDALQKDLERAKEALEKEKLPGPLGELPEPLQEELREKMKEAIARQEKLLEKMLGGDKQEEKEKNEEGSSDAKKEKGQETGEKKSKESAQESEKETEKESRKESSKTDLENKEGLGMEKRRAYLSR